MFPIAPAINPVTGTDINSQFRYTFAHRLAVAKVPGFSLAQPGYDTSFCFCVAQSCHPLPERVFPALFLVVDEFEHENKCSIKATINAASVISERANPSLKVLALFFNRSDEVRFRIFEDIDKVVSARVSAKAHNLRLLSSAHVTRHARRPHVQASASAKQTDSLSL